MQQEPIAEMNALISWNQVECPVPLSKNTGIRVRKPVVEEEAEKGSRPVYRVSEPWTT